MIPVHSSESETMPVIFSKDYFRNHVSCLDERTDGRTDGTEDRNVTYAVRCHHTPLQLLQRSGQPAPQAYAAAE